MTYSLNANTAATLTSFFSLQDQMGVLQNQLATGKKINDPSDNMAVYFKAQSYQTKADFLDDTNGNISLALDHLKLTNKGLGNMIDNLNSARQSLVDALSKPAQVGGQAVNNYGAKDTTGNPVANSAAKTFMTAPAVTTGTTSVALKGKIIDDSADSSTSFKSNDVFAVTVADTAAGTTSTRFFKASAAPADDAGAKDAKLANFQLTGSSVGSALKFYDLDSLAAAVQQAFGTDTLTANAQAVTTTNSDKTTSITGYQFGLALTSATQSISFAQVRGQGGAGDVDAANIPNNPGVTSSFDFSQLIGTVQTNASTYGGQVTTNSVALNTIGAGGALNTVVAGSFSAAQQTAQGNATVTNYTYSGSGGQANAAGVQARQQAAAQLAATLISVDNLLNAGGLPGFVNLFSGQAMNVNVTDDGSQQYNVNLGTPVTVLALGFTGYNANTGSTGFSAGNNFNNNANINGAVAAVDGALSKLTAYSATITSADAGISSRLNFNKSMVDALKAGVTNMTAVNTADASANLTNMQNAGQLVLAAMAKNGQVEQSISRLF